jgi:hypothetical protein
MIDRFTGKNTPYTYDSLVISPNKVNLRGDSDSDAVPDRKEIKQNPFLRAAVPVTMNSETSEKLNNLHNFHDLHDSEESEITEEEENLEDDLHEMIPNLKRNEVRGGYLRKVNAQDGRNSKIMKIQNENENGDSDVSKMNKKKHLRTSSSDEWSVNYVEAEQFQSTSSPVPVVKSINESFIPIQSYLRSSSSSRARLDNSSRPLARHMSSEIFYSIVAVLFAVAVFCIHRLWTTRNSNVPASRKNAKLAVAVTKEMRYNKYEIVSPDSSKLEGTRRRTRTNSEVKKKSSSSTNTFLLFSPQPEQ